MAVPHQAATEKPKATTAEVPQEVSMTREQADTFMEEKGLYRVFQNYGEDMRDLARALQKIYSTPRGKRWAEGITDDLERLGATREGRGDRMYTDEERTADNTRFYDLLKRAEDLAKKL